MAGAQYVLKANEDILDPADGSILYRKDEVISRKTVGTGTWGDIGAKTVDNNFNITWSNLPMGNFRVEEISSPRGYLGDNPHIVTLTSNSTSKELEIQNVNSMEQVKKGYIQVVKRDKDTGKIIKREGAKFEILFNGNVIATITTNSEGVAKSGLLPYAHYEIRESQAPYNYIITTEIQGIDVHENEKVYELNIYNKRVVGQVNISKIDTITGKNAQGEATLEKATYGLYARNPILDPADGSVLYDKNQKVGELITDEKANSTLGMLYLRKLLSKGIKPK